MLSSAIYHPTDSNVFLTGTFSSGIFAWDVRQKKVHVLYYHSLYTVNIDIQRTSLVKIAGNSGIQARKNRNIFTKHHYVFIF